MKEIQKLLLRGFKMDIIELKNVKKKFLNINKKNLFEKKKEFDVLKNINLKVKKGETIGIIGPNGSGKTTLLKTISGILSPDSGEIYKEGRSLVLIDIGSGFQQDLSGRENIYSYGTILGMSREYLKKNEKKIIEFSELHNFIDETISKYSNGMRLRLAFSIVVHANFDILLIDEVLTVGDIAFQNKCINKIYELKSKKKTIMFVSHDIHLVKNLADRSIFLQNGKIISEGDNLKVIEDYINYTIDSKFNKAYKKIIKEFKLYKKQKNKKKQEKSSFLSIFKKKKKEKIIKKQYLILIIELFLNETIELQTEFESQNKEKLKERIKIINEVWDIYSSLTKIKIKILKKKIRLYRFYLSYNVDMSLNKEIFNELFEDYKLYIELHYFYPFHHQ